MAVSGLQALSLLSISLFTLVGTLMGVRLLLLARRTRELPELTLGLALVMIATLGYPLSFASAIFVDSGIVTRLALYTACAGTVDIGILATGVFTRQVFRRESKLAGMAVPIGAVILVGLMAYNIKIMMAVDDPVAFVRAARIPTMIYFGVSTFFFGWAAIESTRWWLQLSKRVRIGLGDPVVANRFLLYAMWGIGTTASSIMHGFYTWLGETLHHPVPLTFSAFCGILNAVCLFLAFFAPRRYEAWVAGDAADADSRSAAS